MLLSSLLLSSEPVRFFSDFFQCSVVWSSPCYLPDYSSLSLSRLHCVVARLHTVLYLLCNVVSAGSLETIWLLLALYKGNRCIILFSTSDMCNSLLACVWCLNMTSFVCAQLQVVTSQRVHSGCSKWSADDDWGWHDQDDYLPCGHRFLAGGASRD